MYVTSQIKTTPGVVMNTQMCQAKLETAFKNYTVDFESVKDIVTFLNYFGQFEREYECSGVCDKKPVYYFSDSGLGEPPRKCQEPITDDVLLEQVLPMGIGFFIVGLIVAIICTVQ